MSPPIIPSSILIVGSGVFGLSTAHALCKNELFNNTRITLVDRHPFPAPDGSSIDTSRIIRPDYASLPYARLASAAQQQWRTTYNSHYKENGLCITAQGASGEAYVASSLSNVQALSTCNIQVLHSEQEIRSVAKTSHATGSSGYINWTSGWANAETAMRQMRSEVESTNRVTFLTGNVSHLLISPTNNRVSGIQLTTPTNTELHAALTILATGSWTPSLLDMRGVAKATGQVLCYLPITAAEQERLQNSPTLINYTTGMFLLPPSNKVLKIARHGHGYVNPVTIPHPENLSSQPKPQSRETITISLPNTTLPVPAEGQQECRHFLAQLHPDLANRPFTRTRICWYTDTPRGDFLIDYHPEYKGLFVATGGSGHGYKFLPVIGEKIVDCVMGKTPEDFRGMWEWPKERLPEEEWEGDGSRGGPRGMVLMEELGKGTTSKL